MSQENLKIKIVYAREEVQYEQNLIVPQGCTVSAALNASPLWQQYQEEQHLTPVIGIFGKIVSLQQKLKAGDRIELYRPLLYDPKLKRRLRL